MIHYFKTLFLLLSLRTKGLISRWCSRSRSPSLGRPISAWSSGWSCASCYASTLWSKNIKISLWIAFRLCLQPKMKPLRPYKALKKLSKFASKSWWALALLSLPVCRESSSQLEFRGRVTVLVRPPAEKHRWGA